MLTSLQTYLDHTPQLFLTPTKPYPQPHTHIDTTCSINRTIDRQNNVRGFCGRCQMMEIDMKCQLCQGEGYCRQCDGVVHGEGKWRGHVRKQCEQGSDKGGRGGQEGSAGSDWKHEQRVVESRYNKLAIKVNQVWNDIGRELDYKFLEIMDLLESKQAEVRFRVERRREKQLDNLRKVCDEMLSTHRTRNAIHSQLETLESLHSALPTRPSTDALLPVTTLLHKLQPKALLPQQTQPIKKPLRSSLFLHSPSHNTHKSPPLLAKMKSFMSQSTLDCCQHGSINPKGEKGEKGEEKVLGKMNSQEKAMRMLGRVRSEKLFGKGKGQ